MNNMKWFEKVCEKQDLLVYTNAEQHNHATLMHCTGNVWERDSITGITFGHSRFKVQMAPSTTRHWREPM